MPITIKTEKKTVEQVEIELPYFAKHKDGNWEYWIGAITPERVVTFTICKEYVHYHVAPADTQTISIRDSMNWQKITASEFLKDHEQLLQKISLKGNLL